jgi:hypothetical protein
MVYHAQKKDSNLLNTGRMEAINVFMRSRYVVKKGRFKKKKTEHRYQTEHVVVIIQEDMIL